MKTNRTWLALFCALTVAPALAQDASLQLTASESLLLTSTSTRLVPVSGVVSGSPESVTFSGDAKVSNRLAKDPDFFSPRYVLTIDLTGVTGIGSTTGAKYAISGPELMHLRVAASHAVEITFPFRGGSARLRTGLASLNLDFDPESGAVTAASGKVLTPNFPR
jgi:hypothetical protein